MSKSVSHYTPNKVSWWGSLEESNLSHALFHVICVQTKTWKRVLLGTCIDSDILWQILWKDINCNILQKKHLAEHWPAGEVILTEDSIQDKPIHLRVLSFPTLWHFCLHWLISWNVLATSKRQQRKSSPWTETFRIVCLGFSFPSMHLLHALSHFVPKIIHFTVRLLCKARRDGEWNFFFWKGTAQQSAKKPLSADMNRWKKGAQQVIAGRCWGRGGKAWGRVGSSVVGMFGGACPHWALLAWSLLHPPCRYPSSGMTGVVLAERRLTTGERYRQQNGLGALCCFPLSGLGLATFNEAPAQCFWRGQIWSFFLAFTCMSTNPRNDGCRFMEWQHLFQTYSFEFDQVVPPTNRCDSTTTTPAPPPEPSTCPEPKRNHHWNLQNLHRNHVKARSLQPMRSSLNRNLFRTAPEPSGTRATAEPPRNLHQNHPGTCTISCTEPWPGLNPQACALGNRPGKTMKNVTANLVIGHSENRMAPIVWMWQDCLQEPPAHPAKVQPHHLERMKVLRPAVGDSWSSFDCKRCANWKNDGPASLALKIACAASSGFASVSVDLRCFCLPKSASTRTCQIRGHMGS